MGRHHYRTPCRDNTSWRLYKLTQWETRCSYLNQPECFSNTQYLLLAITMIWILRMKTRTRSTRCHSSFRRLCSFRKQLKKNKEEKSFAFPLFRLIWCNIGPTSLFKEISSRITLLKQKLLLLCGDVEVNPGPYDKGNIV